ncbi:MAG TPA: hypothetical protein VIA06_12685 [Candidatus Dormibacteraeota bacterium]|nr:hypothetical protein [Candidatus Dormibacteraeota bacterium]
MLIVQEFVSVDGFAADVNGEFGFGGVVSDWSPMDADQLRLVDQSGALLLGRVTYGLFAAVCKHLPAHHSSNRLFPGALISSSGRHLRVARPPTNGPRDA